MKICRSSVLSFTTLILLLSFSSSPAQESLPSLIKRVETSIVVILTYDKGGRFIGQGSGFFVNKTGDVVTSDHVLRQADRAEVKTMEGKIHPLVKVLAEDREGDLIRVSVDLGGETVKPLPISSSLPEVGERVVVIGTPFGLEKTVSDGIVSAIREIPEFGKIIQVTAPISPGSSGSPVLNMKGEVLGVATFFIIAGQNLNFAIPSERIAKLIPGEGHRLSEREEVRIEDWLVSPEGLYATGLRYLWIEEYEKALSHFLEVVKKDPKHATAYFQVGYCLGKLGRYRQAAESYRQAIRIKPDDPDAYNNLCVAYGMTGSYDEAVGACKNALELRPDLAEAYNNLSWAYHKLGRIEEAIKASREAIRIKPDFAMAHYNLGNSYASRGQYGEAIESYKQAIRLKFDYAEAHLNLGAASNRMGRYGEAIESYQQAVRLKPTLAEARLNLGMTYLRTGDRGSALEEYKALKELDKEMANRLFNLIYE